MEQRSDIQDHYHEFIALIERSTNIKAKRYHADNASEFLSLKKMFNKMGIMLTASSLNTLHFNGLAVRMNRTLLSKARAMLAEARTTNRFCGEAGTHAAELQNRAAAPVLNVRTPVEALLGGIPPAQILKLSNVLHLFTSIKNVGLESLITDQS